MKVAIDNNNNIQAFKYQSTDTEVEVLDHIFSNEQVFTESKQARFKVIDGVVTKKTDEELKLEPRWIEYQKEQRALAYKNESDALCFKAMRGEIEMQVWLDKISEIKNRYPY